MKSGLEHVPFFGWQRGYFTSASQQSGSQKSSVWCSNLAGLCTLAGACVCPPSAGGAECATCVAGTYKVPLYHPCRGTSLINNSNSS